MTHHLPQAKALKKLGIPEPVLEFRVSPEPWRKRPFWWTVKIFATRGKMRRYLKFVRPELKHMDEVYAFTDEQKREIVFCLWTMSDQVVSHECWHANAWWASFHTAWLQDCLVWHHRSHERAAEAHGRMVSAVWEQFSKKFPRKECWGFEKPKAKGFYLDRRIY